MCRVGCAHLEFRPGGPPRSSPDRKVGDPPTTKPREARRPDTSPTENSSNPRRIVVSKHQGPNHRRALVHVHFITIDRIGPPCLPIPPFLIDPWHELDCTGLRRA